jgi:hypothetical protein
MKNNCRECGCHYKYCIHGKQKTVCRNCIGTQICIHTKLKIHCKECSPSLFCEHGRKKQFCKKCGGSQICEHGKSKQFCKKCGGSQICEHGKSKQFCKECGGSGYCLIHDKLKQFCKECRGSGYCIHNKLRVYCGECGGSQLCKNCKDVIANKKYNRYCVRCFVHLFPEIPISRNYKTKEKHIVDYVKTCFKDFQWITDRKVGDGCSSRRPDLLLDLGYQVVIIEIDENQHQLYDCSCENKRIMEISQDVGYRPLIFIRFNPDNYIDASGNMIGTCWSLEKNSGLMVVKKASMKAWETRLQVLKEQIEYWSCDENKTEKTIEIVHLFYDGF